MSISYVDGILGKSADEAVDELCSVQESQWFERKSGRIAAKDLSIPLVALANAEGGYLAVGIHGGVVDGVSVDRINELRQVAIDFTTPVVRHSIDELVTDDDKRVLIFHVSPGESVHETVKGECYLRVGDESRRLNFAQRRELEFDRGSEPFDGTPVQATTAELDPEQIEAYRSRIGAATPEKMLEARDLVSRTGRLTVAAWLLFALRPQSLYPSAYIRILRYAGEERGVGAGMTLLEGRDVRCEGSIPEQIDEAARVIDEWMPRVEALAADGKFHSRSIIPRDAWLEGLVNAVLHRSYSMAGDHIRVEIFPNRVEIESPGRFPGLVNPDSPLKISRYARNPRIVRVCSDLGISRELGEGIKRIFEEMRSKGLTDPVYQQSSGSVRLVLSSANALPREVLEDLPKQALGVLDAMRLENRPLGTGEIVSLTGLTRPTVLRHLRRLQANSIVIWEGQSQSDPRASWRLA